MARHLFVLIGCDTDPDREGFVGSLPENSLSWRGMLEGIPRAKERLRSLIDSQGHSPIYTWCLRVDHQIMAIHGSYNYVISNHADFLNSLERDGDELGWHPHFWRYDQGKGCWYQEYWDIPWQLQMLREAHAAYRKVLPEHPRSVRMGWTYHNNETYDALQNLGLEVEFSAIPGLRIVPSSKHVRSSNFFDWSLTPDHPYYPAKADYRREPRDGEEASELLEVPMLVARSPFWGLGAGLQLTRKMKNLSPLVQAFKRPTYIINITGKPSLFAPILRELDRRLGKSEPVVFNTYLHADELIDNKSAMYSLEYMEANLKAVLALANRRKVEVTYIRTIDAKGLLQISDPTKSLPAD